MTEEMNKRILDAAAKENVGTLQDCITNGADINCQNYDGWTPLHFAAITGNTEVAYLMLKAGASLTLMNIEGQSPLHIAAMYGQTEVVDLMLKTGAFPSVMNKEGRTPLHQAAWHGHTGAVDLLLQAGVSLSPMDFMVQTPLHMAAMNGNTEVVDLLLKAEASLSEVDIKGWTPLHWAARTGQIKVLDRLLKAKASLSVVDKMGWTPLHTAASCSHKKVVDLLLQAGAHLFVVDNEGKTPYDVARRGTKTMLQKYKDKVDTKKMPNNIDEIVAQFPMMATKDEIKELMSKGTFNSYENCVYLGGACNVGKSTLAGILIGDEMPPEPWNSTDGLIIYFGRNGIDLKKKKMVPFNQDFDGDVLSKVLRGNPHMPQEKPDTTLSQNREEVLPHDSNKGTIIPETHTVPKPTDIPLSTSIAPTPSLVPGTGKDDVNRTDPRRKQSQHNNIIATFEGSIIEEIRKGTYKIEIAPSDLVDFGGQRTFDMTHQLFMRRKGTFVLMFNGRINFSAPLPEYDKRETTESILKHWVNSILSYCADDDDILPKIMFCATHSDLYDNEKERISRKVDLIRDLSEIFKDHKQQQRIIYEDIFFIDGRTNTDPEIKRLKSKLVDVAFSQNAWGKEIPMAWVPLDIQLSELRRGNMNIISKEELITLNRRNDDLALTDKQTEDFLNAQHSLGKIVYFDQRGLDHFIIVQPQSLVNILRSFITNKMFWPKNKKLGDILCTLTEKGQIAKQDLLKLWSHGKCHQDMPNDAVKEFIIQVLVYLDILVESKHYSQEQESKIQSYLVPCMVKRKPPETDVKSTDKMICLSYTLLKSSMPAALSFKLIGAAMNIWPLKEKEEDICLYHQAAILCIDGSNELYLFVKDDKVFVYLINKKEKGLISPNIASVVQECLTLVMKKVLDFYQRSFGKSRSTSEFEVSQAFEIEIGEWCTSGVGCYISVQEAKEKTEWICKNDRTHHTKYLHYWLFNKKQDVCDPGCPGLDAKVLALEPEDKHLLRLAQLMSLEDNTKFVTKLGLSSNLLKDIKVKYEYGITVTKFIALYEWKLLKYKKTSRPSFQELCDALPDDYNTHLLCQVFLEDPTVYEFANPVLQETPKDDVLKDVAQTVGPCAMHLGIELGLHMSTIEDGRFKYPKQMGQQILNVMEKWKLLGEDKSILMLMKAFQLAEPTGYKFLREKYRV